MSSWSFSSFTTALQCLQKYKYIYVDKLDPNVPESGDLIFGSALHCAINACLTGQDGAATFEIYWSSYKEKEIDYGRYKWAELAQIGSECIRKFIKSHAARYQVEFAEERLHAEYKGVRLEGTLDFYGQYNGRASLRDFKTSARNYDQAKGDSALQLYLYAFLYKANHPSARIDTLGYTVFNKAMSSIQDLTWEFNENKMYEALGNLVEYTKMLESGNYPKNYSACLDYNRKCPYYSLCHDKGDKND